MRGTITIAGIEVDMVANAATPYRFKQVFGQDFFLLSRKMADETDPEVSDAAASDTFIKLGYIMAMQAKGEKMDKLNSDTFLAWLEGFDEANALLEAISEIAAIYRGQERGTISPKR